MANDDRPRILIIADQGQIGRTGRAVTVSEPQRPASLTLSWALTRPFQGDI